MTERGAGDDPNGWVKAEVARVEGPLREEAKRLRVEVSSAISRVLISNNLDGEVSSGVSGAISELIRDRLVEKTFHEILGRRHRCEHQPMALTPIQAGSFHWWYSKSTGRISVRGDNFQRDLITLGEMVRNRTIEKLDAIIYQTASTTRILRGRNLDRWIASVGKFCSPKA